jgi:hypothetical protein
MLVCKGLIVKVVVIFYAQQIYIYTLYNKFNLSNIFFLKKKKVKIISTLILLYKVCTFVV